MSLFGSYIQLEFFMYGGIGFLAAWLMALMVLPAVHGRAERLTRKQYEELPLSLKEMNAEKDQIRAGFAAATRNLEVSIAQLREKTAVHATDLAKKVQLIARLKDELAAISAALSDSESRGVALRAETRDVRRELAIKDAALHSAEREIAAIKAEIGRIAPRLQPAYSDIPTAEVVPLAPVRTPLAITAAPSRLVPPAANGHSHDDEHLVRARIEIEDAARRVDARHENASPRDARSQPAYTPLFKTRS